VALFLFSFLACSNRTSSSSSSSPTLCCACRASSRVSSCHWPSMCESCLCGSRCINHVLKQVLLRYYLGLRVLYSLISTGPVDPPCTQPNTFSISTPSTYVPVGYSAASPTVVLTVLVVLVIVPVCVRSSSTSLLRYCTLFYSTVAPLLVAL
jgi:hypothetical protein